MKNIISTLLIVFLTTVGFSQANSESLIVKLNPVKSGETIKFIVDNDCVISQVWKELPEYCELKPVGTTLPQLKRKAIRSNIFELVEENKVQTANLDFIPNDPSFGTQWYLRQTNDKDMDADEAYDIIPNNAPVTVAMFDGGLDMTHPDLIGNIDYAFNAVTNQIYNGAFVNDLDRHGTACSGTIAAVTNNLTGVASVGFNKVKVMPINIMSNTNGSSFSTTTTIQLNAINAALANPNCVAIAMSYSTSSYSLILNDAFNGASINGRNGKGMFICASTGNGYSGTATNLPANYNGVYGIGATTSSDLRSEFSNFGNIVDIAAPGSAILTVDRQGAAGYNATDYTTISGTSFSCPIAATCGALLIYKNQDLTREDVMSILANSADKVGGYIYDFNSNYPFSTRSVELGYGRINIHRALLSTPNNGNPPPPPVFTHNIVVGSCGISDSNPELGEMIAFTAIQTTTQPQNEVVQSIIQFRVSNDGNWSDDDLVIKTDTVTLGGGVASVASSAVYTPTTYGIKFILAKGDFDNQVNEPVEVDNTCGLSYNVIAAPLAVDLAIEVLSTPWSGCSNTPQPQLRYRFRNVGTEPINSFTWRLSWLNGVPNTQLNNFSSSMFGLNNLAPGAVTATFVQGFNYTTMPEGITITRLVELITVSPTDLNTLNNLNSNTYTRNCTGGTSTSIEENPVIRVVATNMHNIKESKTYNSLEDALKAIRGFYALHIYRKDESLEIIKIFNQ